MRFKFDINVGIAHQFQRASGLPPIFNGRRRYFSLSDEQFQICGAIANGQDIEELIDSLGTHEFVTRLENEGAIQRIDIDAKIDKTRAQLVLGRICSHVLATLAVKGNESVKEIAKELGLPEPNVDLSINFLTNASLVVHTENDLVEPKDDAIALFTDLIVGAIEGLSSLRFTFGNSDDDTLIPKLHVVSTVFSALQTLVIEGKGTVMGLTIRWDTLIENMSTAVEYLTDANLAVRTETDFIEPKNDAIALFAHFAAGAFVGLRVDTGDSSIDEITALLVLGHICSQALETLVVKHTVSVTELAKEYGENMHIAINLLTNTNLVVRTETDFIEPKNDAIALFIDFTFGAMEGLSSLRFTRGNSDDDTLIPDKLHMVSTVFRTLQTVVVEGEVAVEGLAKRWDTSPTLVNTVVEFLTHANLVRTENNLIEPKNDTIALFAKFITGAFAGIHLDIKL